MEKAAETGGLTAAKRDKTPPLTHSQTQVYKRLWKDVKDKKARARDLQIYFEEIRAGQWKHKLRFERGASSNRSGGRVVGRDAITGDSYVSVVDLTKVANNIELTGGA